MVAGRPQIAMLGETDRGRLTLFAVRLMNLAKCHAVPAGPAAEFPLPPGRGRDPEVSAERAAEHLGGAEPDIVSGQDGNTWQHGKAWQHVDALLCADLASPQRTPKGTRTRRRAFPAASGMRTRPYRIWEHT